MNETMNQPIPVSEPAVNDGLICRSKPVLQTANGQIEIITAVHHTVLFLASYGVQDTTKPPYTVFCTAHDQMVYSPSEGDAQALLFAPGTWCPGCKALLAMPPVAPPLPTTVLAGAPVVVPAHAQVQLEHVSQGNGQQTASAQVAPAPAAAAPVSDLPVLTVADRDSIMATHFEAKAEVVRLTAELEAAKLKAAAPFKPFLDRGIKKIGYRGVTYSLVQKQGQLPYLRATEK